MALIFLDFILTKYYLRIILDGQNLDVLSFPHCLPTLFKAMDETERQS